MSAISEFRDALVGSLGYAPEVIEPGKLMRFATSERRSDKAGWCKLFHDMRGGVFGCYRQGVSEAWSVTDRATLTREQRAKLENSRREREAQQAKEREAHAKSNKALWNETVCIELGDPVALYLRRRGIDTWPLPDCLRHHRALPYWHEGKCLGKFAAMVAPLTAPDGRIVALHRSFLTADGSKASVPSPKKLTPAAGPLVGACIPLHKPARGVIGIAEGIETALAAWCASGIPTVAAYCAGNLAAWRWPAGVQRIAVFADNDKAGREAAEHLRARALGARLRCEVHTPSTEGNDWADVWAQRAGARSAA
jgi:putative DNA primase/helicase